MNVSVQIYTCVTLAPTIAGIRVHSAVTPVETLRQSIAIGPKSWSQLRDTGFVLFRCVGRIVKIDY